jgi:predicted nucleic acid-binding protein
MRVLLDTNVLVAAVTLDTDRSHEAIELLDRVDDPLVSVRSLMELRSVLSKRNGSNGTESMPSRTESPLV